MWNERPGFDDLVVRAEPRNNLFHLDFVWIPGGDAPHLLVVLTDPGTKVKD